MVKEVFFFSFGVKIFPNKFYCCASGGSEKEELDQEEFLEKLVAAIMRWPW